MGIFVPLTMAALFSLSSSSTPFQQGGEQGIYQGNSVQSMERGLATYLNSEMQKSILTPGESVDWKLKLKAGQVVVGEAQSEAFDPAALIVDSKGAVMATNDDRYPGDQRPLLFWRCQQDGDYVFRVQSFQGKSGGQVFARFETYNCLDLSSERMTESVIPPNEPFMVRIPMQAGQVKDLMVDRGGNFINCDLGVVISPNGLPERLPSFAVGLSPAIRALVAPLAGDYYMLMTPHGSRGGEGRVRIGTRDYVPSKLTLAGGKASAKAPTGRPGLWEVDTKAGDLLELTLPELHPATALSVGEVPDFSKFDLSKPETNPFFPVQRSQQGSRDVPFEILPGRARDGRVMVLYARRDAKLWIASSGAGPSKEYSLNIRPAAAEYSDQKSNSGKLRIGNTDYWAFDAKAGDVMTFKANVVGFSQEIRVRDPQMNVIRVSEAELDQTTDEWRMIVQRPGRYLVSVSCQGDGGGGDYSLSRQVYHAKEFSRSTPAKAEISEGEIQIWKFTATPGDPLLIRWTSTAWTYDVSICDDKGNPTNFQRQNVDEHNTFGLLKVDQPRTYVIVLTGSKGKSSYSIELNSIPGYKPASGKSAK